MDSGITLTHPDFQNSDGTTRFIRFWDQTSDGTPPVGLSMGTEWSSEQINTALRDNLRLRKTEAAMALLSPELPPEMAQPVKADTRGLLQKPP